VSGFNRTISTSSTRMPVSFRIASVSRFSAVSPTISCRTSVSVAGNRRRPT